MTGNYTIDFSNIPIISKEKINLSREDKKLIITKLLDAHKLACANVELGNITKRGFAANVCTYDGFWALGTNFNNTRNEISSICAERSAILSLYNTLMINYINKKQDKFDFRIKYICMAQNIPIDQTSTTPVPCEDCLSWLNTNKFFDDNTLVFSFEKPDNGVLSIKAVKLSTLLPYKGFLTKNEIDSCKIIYSSLKNKNIISEKIIRNLLDKTFESYKNSNSAYISKQNISCSIFANNEIFTSNRIDWTKRWFLEPLELSCAKAVEKFGSSLKIDAICYFGDEFTNNHNEFFPDGVVSIKSLGRIRRKYAVCDTLLILNTAQGVFVTTIAEYLPKKFIQGYNF